jgi:hypothetical protein
MFETSDFRNQVGRTFSAEAARRGMKTYNTGIIDRLCEIAIGNERLLLEREQLKPAPSRRGVSDALSSVIELSAVASDFALRSGRDNVNLSDLEMALQARFCQVWPFCK